MDTTLLRTLVETYAPSGCETKLRELIRTLAAPYADDITEDALGNLIVHKQGSGPKLMFAAHMDSIGMMVTHIEDKGFLRFRQVGGLEPAAIYQQPVRFANGTVGIVSVNESKLESTFKLSDLFIDIGAASREEAENLVQVGDVAVFAAPYLESRCQVVSPYMDNRAGCFALLETLKSLKDPQNDLFFVFTAQEEVGTRGARTAAWGIDPAYGIAVDVTCPDDVPGAVHDGSTAMGKGAAIKIMDSNTICSPRLVKTLRTIAAMSQIPVQDDVLQCGGTDGGAMLVTRGGVITGGISIPCRYTHAPTELIFHRDLEAVIRLLCAVCERNLDEYDA